jgi:hypothetical protein
LMKCLNGKSHLNLVWCTHWIFSSLRHQYYQSQIRHAHYLSIVHHIEKKMMIKECTMNIFMRITLSKTRKYWSDIIFWEKIILIFSTYLKSNFKISSGVKLWSLF